MKVVVDGGLFQGKVSMMRHVMLVVGFGVGLAGGVSAQPLHGVLQQDVAPPTWVNLSSVSSDYEVGPGDSLDIQVVGHDDLRQVLSISNSGEISFSMLGSVRVADLTAFEVETLIADRLRSEGLIQEPEVLVYIQDYQAKPINVLGSVANPGQFIMSQELTVVDALLLAGGLRPEAGDEGLLHRRVSPEGWNVPATSLEANPSEDRQGIEIIKFDLTPLKEGWFIDAALPLKRGDVIVVPERLTYPFFVAGAVLNPRNYSFQPEFVMTASQAISRAGGPTPTAKMSDGMLVRYDEEGVRHEMAVDYAAILEGRQPDFAIQRNDLIFIPSSKVKTITHGLLVMTDVMVMQQSFRVGRRIQLPERPDAPVAAP